MAHHADETANDDASLIGGINVTPLVDIMLVLLIIFMVAARLEGPRSVGVELPRAASGADTPPATLSIVIPHEGDVRLDGRPIAPGALAGEVQRRAGGSPESQAVVSADRRVPYDRVVAVVDAVRLGGVRKLALAVEGAE
jgi:biopolymer transport protein ExbD